MSLQAVDVRAPNQNLSDDTIVVFQIGHFVYEAGVAVLAADLAPFLCGNEPDAFHQRRESAPERDRVNVSCVELIDVLMGGESAVKDPQMTRPRPFEGPSARSTQSGPVCAPNVMQLTRQFTRPNAAEYLLLIMNASARTLLCFAFTLLLKLGAVEAQQVQLEQVTVMNAPERGLFDITDVVIGNDGAVYVLDEKAFRVFKFDAAGKLVGQAGREGGGPGEFQTRPVDIALSDRYLYVSSLERALNPLHRFDLNLNFVDHPDWTGLPNFGVSDAGLVYVSHWNLWPGFKDRSKVFLNIYDENAAEPAFANLENLSENHAERDFTILTAYPDSVVLVFRIINRIDVRDARGNLVRQFTIPDAPHRIKGPEFSESTRNGRSQVYQVAEEFFGKPYSFIPFPMVGGADITPEGLLFLDVYGKVWNEPSKEQMRVLDLSGNELARFQLPRNGLRFMAVDQSGHLYARSNNSDSADLYKFKYEFLPPSN